MEPTQINEFLPIGIVHVVVNDLSAVRCRHSPCAPGDLIEWGPKRFNCLAIYLLGAFNEAG